MGNKDFFLKIVHISVIILLTTICAIVFEFFISDKLIFARKERKIIMKNNLTLTGIFVVIIFSLIIFTGCAEKKSVVTNSDAQEQVSCTRANTGANNRRY